VKPYSLCSEKAPTAAACFLNAASADVQPQRFPIVHDVQPAFEDLIDGPVDDVKILFATEKLVGRQLAPAGTERLDLLAHAREIVSEKVIHPVQQRDDLRPRSGRVDAESLERRDVRDERIDSIPQALPDLSDLTPKDEPFFPVGGVVASDEIIGLAPAGTELFEEALSLPLELRDRLCRGRGLLGHGRSCREKHDEE